MESLESAKVIITILCVCDESFGKQLCKFPLTMWDKPSMMFTFGSSNNRNIPGLQQRAAGND